MSSKRPDYIEPCNCGECPRMPADRPATKREALAYVEHRYAAHRPRRWVLQEAIGRYVWSYVSWVNTRGWRKPPEWTGGRVRACDLRPASKAFFPEDASKWRRELLAKMERKLSDSSTES